MTNSMSGKDVNSNLKVAGFAILGILVFVAHIGVFLINQYAFNILVCIYILVYSILVFIIMMKNIDCFSKPVFNITINLSLYTMFLQVFLIIFTLVMFYRKK